MDSIFYFYMYFIYNIYILLLLFYYYMNFVEVCMFKFPTNACVSIYLCIYLDTVF